MGVGELCLLQGPWGERAPAGLLAWEGEDEDVPFPSQAA